MSVVSCDVCETSQRPARECVTCGLPLRLPADLERSLEPEPGLPPGFEATGLDRVGEIALAPPDGFEATVETSSSAVEVDFVEGWEPNGELEWIADDDEEASGPPPGFETLAEGTALFVEARPEAARRRCAGCGAFVDDRPRCSECGQPLAR